MDLQGLFVWRIQQENASPHRALLQEWFPFILRLRIAALVWHTWSDEEEKGCLWSYLNTVSTTVISGANMSLADHIHFWNLFQPLNNWSEKRTRLCLHFISKERESIPCLSLSHSKLQKSSPQSALEIQKNLDDTFMGYSL